MRFMLIVYLDEQVEARKSDAERDEMFERCFAHSAEWKRQGVMEAGEPLHPTPVSTSVRVRDGKTILTPAPRHWPPPPPAPACPNPPSAPG